MAESSCGFSSLFEMMLCILPIFTAVGFLKLGAKWRNRK